MHAFTLHACTCGILSRASVRYHKSDLKFTVERRQQFRSIPRCASSSGAVDGRAEAQLDMKDEAGTPTIQPEQPKPHDLVKRLRLRIGVANIPHPDKISYGGEDAWFASDIGGGALGVADGVGGWSESEVNPAEYAKTFMLVARLYLEGKDVRMNESNGSVQLIPQSGVDIFDGANARSPQGALDAGHVATRLPGSATACVVRLNRDASTISAANLGDSGFMLVRDGFVSFRSPVLQHFFDCPLQFGAVPEHTKGSDYAEDADLFEIKVRVGDHIIAASDGLWDNARDDEMLDALSSAGPHPEQAAQALAQLAQRNAGNESYESPYTVEALRQGVDLPWLEKIRQATFSRTNGLKLGKLQGGKMDDITVLVAVVDQEEVCVPRQQPTAEQNSDEPAPSQAAAAVAQAS